MTDYLGEKYMKEALRLARKGAGLVGTNPMVGCVIAKNGKIVGKGYYKNFGGDHAEVMALKDAKKKNKKVSGTTVYVTLEPHSFHGKTPPCTETLIQAKVKRVVIGTKDPNPRVAGDGVRKLKKAGIEVEVGVLEKECKELIETFAKYITTGKPFVLLKMALTKDFALTLKKGKRSKLSSDKFNKRVHELRQEYDAIAVGINTVLVDDPRLTYRPKIFSRAVSSRKDSNVLNPIRVIFDTKLQITEHARMFAEPGETLVFVGKNFNKDKKIRLEKKFKMVKIIPMTLDKNGHVDLKKIFMWLGKSGITSIMVEGGAKIASEILDKSLADKYFFELTRHEVKGLDVPRIKFESIKKYFDKGKFEKVVNDLWLTVYK